jgi:predicted nucleotidyltransferase
MEKVKEILEELEVKYNIKIIYAVEAGSRAWNLKSEDSDFDIRYIFRHNDPKKYVSLQQLKETIDGFSEDRLYDWQGWDIKKALKHVRDMNPSMTEWLVSPIVYYSDEKINFREKAFSLLKAQNRILPLVYHYISMAKANYKQHIENKQLVNIKKYLHVIRPAGMVEWLRTYKRSRSNLVEIDFFKVLYEIKDILDKECYEDILKVIEKKKLHESTEEPRLKSIDSWIESVLQLKISKQELNDLDYEKNGLNSLNFYDEFLFEILNIK